MSYADYNVKSKFISISKRVELGQELQDSRIVPDLLLRHQEVLVPLGPLPFQPLVHHVQEEALAVQILHGHPFAVLLDLLLQNAMNLSKEDVTSDLIKPPSTMLQFIILM